MTESPTTRCVVAPFPGRGATEGTTESGLLPPASCFDAMRGERARFPPSRIPGRSDRVDHRPARITAVDLKDQLRERLEACEAIEFAILFGSRAMDAARPSSDVDVAVFLRPDSPPAQRWRTRLDLAGELESLGEVDIVVLNDAPPLLAHRALGGQILFVRNRSSYVGFYRRTMALAEDERYFQRIHEEERRSRLREGRFGRP